MMTTLPSFSAILAGPAHFPLSADETRELAKCANGDLVSHDVVRDGIDALLQLKSASYDAPSSEEELDMRHRGILRICPEPFSSGNPMVGAVMDESSDEDEHDSDYSTYRSKSPPAPEFPNRKARPTKRGSNVAAPSDPPFRPPTIWHHRK